VERTTGDVIGVPCQVKPGPFSTELLISFETINGPISGFVRESELKQTGEQWHVRAVVQSVQPDSITVRIRGSFFTTNGIATIPAGMALAA
jgi:hypothetical protein